VADDFLGTCADFAATAEDILILTSITYSRVESLKDSSAFYLNLVVNFG
jgi:hypothetical protein